MMKFYLILYIHGYNVECVLTVVKIVPKLCTFYEWFLHVRMYSKGMWVNSFNLHIWSHDFSHLTDWSTGKLSDMPDFIEQFNCKQFCSEGILAHAAVTHYHRIGWFKNKHLFRIVLEAGSSRLGRQRDCDLDHVSAFFLVYRGPCCCVLAGQGGSSLTSS